MKTLNVMQQVIVLLLFLIVMFVYQLLITMILYVMKNLILLMILDYYEVMKFFLKYQSFVIFHNILIVYHVVMKNLHPSLLVSVSALVSERASE